MVKLLSIKTKQFLLILFLCSLCLATIEALTFIFVSKLLEIQNNNFGIFEICFLEDLCVETTTYFYLGGLTVVLLFVFSLLTIWITSEVGSRISTDLAVHYFAYYRWLPINVLASEGAEKTQNILLNETYRIGNAVVLPCLISVVKFIQVTALLCIAISTTGLYLFAAGLLPMIVYVLITLLVASRLKSIGKLFTSTFENRLQLVSSSYLGIKEIKIDSTFHRAQDAFCLEQTLLERNQVKYALISNFPKYFLELIFMSVLIFAIYAHILDLFKFNISDVLLFGFFALRLVPILQNIYSSISSVLSNRISFQNYFQSIKWLDQSSEGSNCAVKVVNDPNVLGGITLADGSDFLIFEDKKYLVIGPSGIGKTSMVDFMIGLRSDHLANRFLNSATSSDRIHSYCSQNTFIDDQFIARLASKIQDMPTHTAARISKLISAFSLTEIITAKLDVRNVHFQLSGGERQRLAIASCLTKDADFFVFDEPTNNLDTASKLALTEFLLNFNKGFILISHDDEISHVAQYCIQCKEGSDKIRVISV